ncbi:MFS transporter [Pontiella sulfatireligans]|uniref:Bifunctional protein Aas n=1 Tax=Pontiella sulfatireligans TaxID=2750658 RepID=A0A6C2UE58_9BACT|nr:MFS transporter [Pontiella sulfatireligans]VGO18408.1 Bifunctional protein Aas [Pontiella sulfatireligans]
MKKTFKWLNISQFTGAFNDNAFKMTAAIVLVKILGEGSLPTVLAICSALFVIPFLLFSNVAGTLADRFSKRDIIVASKWLEVALFVFAIPALLSGLAWPLYALLFLLCTQSALFGPAKRGIVPELVDDGALSRANGFLTAATYMAIIFGTAMPSLLIGYIGTSPFYVIGTSLALAATGIFSAYRIAKVSAAGSSKKSSPWIIPDVVRAVKNLKSDHWAKQAVLGLVLFGAITALLQQTLVIFGRDALNLSIEKSPMLFPLAAIGIGIGALLTGRFSKHTIEIGLIPVGALGVMISSFCISVTHHPILIGFWIINLGACCGMYLVPLNAFLQHRIPKDRRGEVFGAASFLSFSAMVAASGLFYVMTQHLHFGARRCVFVTGLIAAVPAIIACMRLPNFFTRFWLMRLIRSLYKIRFSGVENLPREGGALLICNHTAYADPLLLQAATQRPVRFLMSRDVFKTWKWCKPLFKLTDCIPIHTSDGPRALAQSLKEAREAMEAGAIIAIFPEGELTKDGNLMKFNKGFERIAKNSDCPIIPAHIGNLWGSIFSFQRGKPGLKRPLKFPYPVSVRFGQALPTDTSADEARRVIAELGAEYATEQSLRPDQTLSHQFVKQARRNWFRPIATDTLTGKASYGKLLIGAVALANRIKPCTKTEKNVGIFMPTTLGGVMANLAVTLSGKTSVNLNWTASEEAQLSAIQQARIKYVITSRRFLQKTAQPYLPVRWLYLEDLLKNLGRLERVRAVRAALMASPKHLAGGRTPKPSDVATIIFSSGTTGMPKGVVLSHANILSNVESVQTAQQFSTQNSMCATLPLFHAFGFLGLLWWPLFKGIRVAYHPNPLQTGRVIQLIKEEKLTALLTTPTFLQNYMRKASAADFQTLEIVIAGGEKLRPQLADLFEKKFGVKPLEGYGCTELSPVAALGSRNGTRTGSVGQALPGIAVKIVGPETHAPLPNGEEGLLLVKGPNVMQEYLGQPEKSAEVLRDGWYNTGDIARMDGCGFIYITGRLSRFSKIAGEMIPHGLVEEALQQATETEEPCVAVVGIADEAKGEQLAVCFTQQAGDPETLVSKLRNLGLPNLWIPRAANFFSIPELPILGTGKLDLCAVNAFVQGA